MIFCNEPRKSEEEKGYLKKIWRGMRNPATYSTPLYMNYYYEIISLALSFTLRASPFFLGRACCILWCYRTFITNQSTSLQHGVRQHGCISMMCPALQVCPAPCGVRVRRGGGLKKCFGHCNCSRFVVEGILHVEFEVGTWEIIFDSVHMSLVNNGPTMLNQNLYLY